MLKYLVVASSTDNLIEVVAGYATRKEAEDFIKTGEEGEYHLAVVEEGYEAVKGANLE